MKIEQKGESDDMLNIIKFKNFDEVQDFYDVISTAAHCSWLNTDDYDLTAYLKQAVSVARVVTNKPVLYILENREYADDHYISSNLKELSDYVNIYLDEIVDKNAPVEFIKIAKLFKKHVAAFVTPDFYSDVRNKCHR